MTGVNRVRVIDPPSCGGRGAQAVAKPGPGRRGPGVAGLVATGVFGAVGGALLGGLVGSGASSVLLVALLLGPAVLVGTMVRPAWGLLVLALLVFTHLSDVAVEFYGAPSLLQPFLLVLVLAVGIRVVRDRELPSGLGTPTLLILAYGAVLSLGLFFVRDAEPTLFALNTYVRDAVVALLVVALLRTGRSLERFTWVLILSGGLLAGLGVLQYVTGSFEVQFGGFAQASVKNIAGGTSDYRISGPIADPNHWAQALLVIIPLALGRMRRSRTVWARSVGAGALLACVLAVVFTYSRGALVALVLLGLLALCLRPPPLWAVAASVAAIVLALPLLPGGYVDRLGQLAEALPGVSQGRTGEASLSSRLSALLAGQQMALDHPFLGVGAGQFPERYREYSLGLGVDNAQGGVAPHNMYVEVAAETGYAGVLSWGALLGVSLWRLGRGREALRRAGRLHHADLVEDLGLALAGYLLGGLFVHNAYPRLYWLLIGAALAMPAVVRSVLSAAGAADAGAGGAGLDSEQRPAPADRRPVIETERADGRR